MPIVIEDIDRGYKKFLAQLRLAKRGPIVKIGIQDDAGLHGDSGTTIADIATFNEFGAPGANIPERSFIRSTMDENRQALLKLNKELFFKLAEGRMTTKRALNILGLKIVTLIRKKITDLKDPPNKPATIAHKGSSNPLIDTGLMRASIRHRVEMDGDK